jgi:hypothetical protein
MSQEIPGVLDSLAFLAATVKLGTSSRGVVLAYVRQEFFAIKGTEAAKVAKSHVDRWCDPIISRTGQRLA